MGDAVGELEVEVSSQSLEHRASASPLSPCPRAPEWGPPERRPHSHSLSSGTANGPATGGEGPRPAEPAAAQELGRGGAGLRAACCVPATWARAPGVSRCSPPVPPAPPPRGRVGKSGSAVSRTGRVASGGGVSPRDAVLGAAGFSLGHGLPWTLPTATRSLQVPLPCGLPKAFTQGFGDAGEAGTPRSSAQLKQKWGAGLGGRAAGEVDRCGVSGALTRS